MKFLFWRGKGLGGGVYAKRSNGKATANSIAWQFFTFLSGGAWTWQNPCITLKYLKRIKETVHLEILSIVYQKNRISFSIAKTLVKILTRYLTSNKCYNKTRKESKNIYIFYICVQSYYERNCIVIFGQSSSVDDLKRSYLVSW